MSGYVTRIAPSPSGYFHIGTARTAYHNWLAARATGGKFILRIDDTNQALSDRKYVDVIADAMSWLGLDHDFTFTQNSRLDRYRQVADDLLHDGKAVRVDGGAVALSPSCSCHVPASWSDSLVKTVHASDDDRRKALGTVLLRGDGTPTYHFATVVDDHDYGVNYVIRGQDHISNTLRQVTIYHCLGWDRTVPLYAHVGLIHKDGKKMSKRDGAASLLSYRDQSYDPDAMLNYLLRLGWGPRVDDRTANHIPRDRALQLFFTGGQLRPARANFDQAKLDWYDRLHKAMKKRTAADDFRRKPSGEATVGSGDGEGPAMGAG
jgi:glutamyl-tRNA synthetase